MRKIVFLIVVVSLVLFSCKSNYTRIGDKNANYIPYYLKVYEAKKLFGKEKHIECFNLLDSLFNKYKPLNTLMIYELEIFCELATKFNKTDKLDSSIELLISESGYDLTEFNDSLWLEIKKKTKFTKNELKLMHNNYTANINHDLRDSIVKIFNEDQLNRNKRTKIEIDSLDRLKEHRIVNIIKKYGYPSIKKVGGLGKDDKIKPAYMSVLLKHVSYKSIKEIEPLLLDEVKKGNCLPSTYASMLDVRKIIANEETPFIYYGTINNIKPKDTLETNNAREKIGLPRINFNN